jgi:C_GCAxxG_C_C family probable redox protein
MKSKTEIAVEKFAAGYNCAQSVFYSFCDDFKFEKNTALKLACGFGAGMDRNEEVCGAISGGIMVLGLKYGRGEKDGLDAKELAYAKTRELMGKFARKHRTYICRQLLNGCDLATDAGQKQYKANDLSNKVCKLCVQSVVEILENIL